MCIDIIIPIYNAYEYTVECIKSIMKHTDLQKNRLILINDKSPDARIKEYLDQLEIKPNEQIQILHNEVNLGFVGTVNRGMSLSQNDVILLNSDTEVTAKWVEKMSTAAKRNPNIGTVTALTNNGTICSVPNFCEDNNLPEGLTLDEYAEIIENTSLKMYPTIPTAVGFCMYIKREVINKVGLFDKETFGKGYGEENDFCCRALEHGYYHILCDDTFIYHKGSTSFLGDKEKFIKHNLEILNNRYPYYNGMIEEFVKTNPIEDIHTNIKLQLKLRNGKSNVLFVLHNDFFKGENHPIGGTEYHTKDIIDYLEEVNSFIMYVKKETIHLEAILDGEVQKFKFKLPGFIGNLQWSDYNYRKEVSKILDYFRIDSVHIQHLRTHTFDVVDLANEKNIPVYITLHDFYAICPKVNLLDDENKYCLNIQSEEKCKKCLKKAFGYNESILEDWHENFYRILKKVNRIFTPSESAKRIISNFYKKLDTNFDLNIEVKEHGIEPVNIEEITCDSTNNKFKIAFIGGLAPYKGSQLAYELIKKDQSEKFEWHIFGNIGDEGLLQLEKDNLIKHGRYERNEIVELLVKNKIDLVCILSIWPETYSYTISESILAQKPMLVVDIGALGDRIREYNCGWTIEVGQDISEISQKIDWIYSHTEIYNEKVNNVKKVKLPTKQEVAKDYEKLYKKIPSKTQICLGEEYNRQVLANYKKQEVQKHEMQVFLDKGNGFNEADSYRILATMNTEQRVYLEIPINEEKEIRLDPTEQQCIMEIESIIGFGQDIYIPSYSTNGDYTIGKHIVFTTMDPQIIIHDLQPSTNKIGITLRIQLVKDFFKQDMDEGRIYNNFLQDVLGENKALYQSNEALRNEVTAINGQLEVERQLRQNQDAYIQEVHGTKIWKLYRRYRNIVDRR